MQRALSSPMQTYIPILMHSLELQREVSFPGQFDVFPLPAARVGGPAPQLLRRLAVGLEVGAGLFTLL